MRNGGKSFREQRRRVKAFSTNLQKCSKLKKCNICKRFGDKLFQVNSVKMPSKG